VSDKPAPGDLCHRFHRFSLERVCAEVDSSNSARARNSGIWRRGRAVCANKQHQAEIAAAVRPETRRRAAAAGREVGAPVRLTEMQAGGIAAERWAGPHIGRSGLVVSVRVRGIGPRRAGGQPLPGWVVLLKRGRSRCGLTRSSPRADCRRIRGKVWPRDSVFDLPALQGERAAKNLRRPAGKSPAQPHCGIRGGDPGHAKMRDQMARTGVPMIRIAGSFRTAVRGSDGQGQI